VSYKSEHESDGTAAKPKCEAGLAAPLGWANGWKGRRKWKAQYEKQKGLCYLCGAPIPVEKMTKDHVTPRARGGSPQWSNIWLACEPCNQRKADRALAIQTADENMHAAWASGDDYDIRRCLLVLETILSASSPNAKLTDAGTKTL